MDKTLVCLRIISGKNVLKQPYLVITDLQSAAIMMQKQYVILSTAF